MMTSWICTGSFQGCQHRQESMEKPQPLTTPHLELGTIPSLLSLCQNEHSPNPGKHQHSARKKFQKKSSLLLISHFFMPRSRGQTLMLWFFNPSKLKQLNLFMPYENPAHPAHCSSSSSSNTIIIKYFSRLHSRKCF